MAKGNDRILLINPLVGDRYEFTRANRPAPLGLLSIAALVRDTLDVRVLDQRMDTDFAERLREEVSGKPRIVGIHVMGGPQIRKAMSLSQRIKSWDKTVPVAWGGAFPTMMPEACAGFAHVDYVIRGEGEQPFLRLVQSLGDRRAPDDVPSISFVRDGRYIENELAPQTNLDDLPEPAYDLVDLAHYDWSANVNQPIGGLKLQMETSRGCLSRCIFCYNPFFYQKTWRALSATRTVDRMETLSRRYGVRHIDIIDDSFFEDLDRVRDVAAGLLRKNMKIPYLLNGGKVGPILDMADADLRMLRDSGCGTIFLGAESGSDRMLQQLAKGITAEQILSSNRKLARIGIQPSYYFMCGIPGETEEDLRMTTRAMFAIMSENPRAKIIAAFSFTPFARTPGFKIAQSYGMPEPKTLDEWADFDTLNTLQPWLTGRQKRQVRAMFFFAMFIDRKIDDLSPSPLVRFAARLYRPVARWRMKNLRLGFAFEERIGQFLLGLMNRRG